MNQAILLNDDLHFDLGKNYWLITGQLNGEIITIKIKECYLAANTPITESLIFDIEDNIERWLKQHEPEGQQVIFLKFLV